ncbi:MAG: hypothetical protein HY537_19115 [Deltaproteobacteria bacterium]|nr:hypothetical protein [Deltaproteobacteria bacterium]
MKPYIGLILFGLLLFETFRLLPPQIPTPPLNPVSDVYPRIGSVHLHTTFSDGGGDVEEVARSAAQSGMDFIVLTDHNVSTARQVGKEKNMGTVDVFAEMEASTPAGHLVIFYSHTSAVSLPDERVRELAFQHFLGSQTVPGIFVVTAHPSNVKNPWSRLDRFPDGTEVINLDSVWQRQAYESLAGFSLTTLIYPFNNYLGALRFLQIYPKDFESWDAMNVVKPGHFGILAHDSHSKVKLRDNMEFRWPSYTKTFRLAANAILLKEPPAADFHQRKVQLYTAIREGRIALFFPVLHPFRGNDWSLECKTARHRSGDHVVLDPQCSFTLRVPEKFPYPLRARVIKDGKVIFETAASPLTRFPLQGPGIYRVELWSQMSTPMHLWLSREVPYLFYNPIYVK